MFIVPQRMHTHIVDIRLFAFHRESALVHNDIPWSCGNELSLAESA